MGMPCFCAQAQKQVDKSEIYLAISSYDMLSSDSVINKLKSKLENQYIQICDSKSNICDKLKLLNILKKNNYKSSVYLSNIQDINSRKKITRLRLGCSKLKTHSYLKPGADNNCVLTVQKAKIVIIYI